MSRTRVNPALVAYRLRQAIALGVPVTVRTKTGREYTGRVVRVFADPNERRTDAEIAAANGSNQIVELDTGRRLRVEDLERGALKHNHNRGAS